MSPNTPFALKIQVVSAAAAEELSKSASVAPAIVVPVESCAWLLDSDLVLPSCFQEILHVPHGSKIAAHALPIATGAQKKGYFNSWYSA